MEKEESLKQSHRQLLYACKLALKMLKPVYVKGYRPMTVIKEAIKRGEEAIND